MGMMKIPMVVHEPDFMIHGVLKYEAFGQELWITDTTVGAWIITAVLLLIGFIANRKIKAATDSSIPGAFQNALEMSMEALENMAQGILAGNARKFVNYIGTIFLFILFCNLSGLFGLRAPTADYGVTFALGLITFTLITFNKFKYQKVSGVIKGLCDPWPIWAPINVIGDIAVPISLSLRLFANVLSGTVMMALIYGLLGFIATAWPAALHVYFDLFSGAIQTYVFCMLTMTYINNAIEG